MRDSHWDHLLKLLGLIVMMDGKIYQEEVLAFSRAAKKLQETLSPELFLTDTMIKDWFVNHRAEIKAIVDSLDYDRKLLEIIGPIRTLPEKKLVLKAMVNIAKSDGSYHTKEKMIIKKAAKYWNVQLSDFHL
jgi:uncharacterized tellurite resistance protein B-like protein